MTSKKRNKKWLRLPSGRRMVLTLTALLLIAGAGFFILKYNDDSPTPSGYWGRTSSGDSVNLNPPTETEKQETEVNKKDLSNQGGQQNNQTNNPSGKVKVTPVIVNANKNEISAFVQGIVEDGGICTATLTNSSSTVTKSSTGIANVSYTTCPPINLGNSLGTGTWTVVVSYDSSKAAGQSSLKTFKAE